MKDRVFFDSNVLIYAYSSDDIAKEKCVDKLLNSHGIIILSTQTINEFINVMTKKKKTSYQQVAAAINEMFDIFLIETIDIIVIQKAIDIATKYRYSYFDSLMIASALNSNCSILYTEDMHNTHVIEDNLQIINPFI
ncbi:hypothetical protein A3F66_02735 [candidate division TM6 bacterium RIFCSPHIGHO2_12_FULL_32_22]|nr:MAG: hypothetical protein A3F66_02735 [candidate division TM6 bacterium RIFCSPHIGHO2_12_FULL_32_22]